MGGLVPLAAAGLAMKAQSDQAALARRAAAEQAAYDSQQQALANQIDSDRRRQALKQALATQRAGMGAAGIDAGQGSAKALLLGLTRQAEQEEGFRADSLALRASRSASALAARRKNDLLGLAETRRQSALSLMTRQGPFLDTLFRG